MQHLIPVEQIISRCLEIRLPVRVLATAAHVQPSTIYKARERGGCRSQTLRVLQDVLIAEEQRLLTHLAALHPVALHPVAP